jgi:hypothetical protein
LVRQENKSGIRSRFLVGNYQFKLMLGLERLDWEEAVLKVMMFLSTGAALEEVSVDSLGSCSASGFSSVVAGLSILVLFWRELVDSGLGDRALLLVSLVLPGGGERDGVPANGERVRGGKLSRVG